MRVHSVIPKNIGTMQHDFVRHYYQFPNASAINKFPALFEDGEFYYFKTNSFCPALNSSAPVSVTSTSSSNPT